MRKSDCSLPISIPLDCSKVLDSPNPSTARVLSKVARDKTCRNHSFSEISRWEVIERNLSDGLGFLNAQDRSLALIGSLLDQFRKSLIGRGSIISKCRKTQIRLMHEVFVEGLRNIQRATHRDHPLFDDGTSPPLKFHVMTQGRRETIEVSRVNLSQPALSALSFCPSGRVPGEFVILDAIREIVELRTNVFRNSSSITEAHKDVLAKIRSRNSTRSSLCVSGKNSKRSQSVSCNSLRPLTSNKKNLPFRGVRLFRKLFLSDARLSEV